MMCSFLSKGLRFAAILALIVSSNSAFAATDFEEYCNVPNHQSSARHSIIIIDEVAVVAEPDRKPLVANQPWRRFVLELLDVRRTGISHDFLPRERVSLLMARRDGGGLTRLFSGCLPFFSDEEKKAIADQRGNTMNSVDTFFGWGQASREKKDADRLANLLNGSMLEAARPDRISEPVESRELLKSGLFSSLGRSRIVELSLGIPRIFIFSDLTRFDFPGATDPVTARELGMKLGEQSQIDLERSEIYVSSSGSAKSPEIARELFHSFFLQARARLMSFSGSPTLPNVSANPLSVRIYQGKITYARDIYPIRMRLSTDRNGTAVNSWISVQTDRDRLTPLGGVLTCGNSKNPVCKFIGDKVFAQIWTKNPNPEPEFENWMPFSGAREIEFELNGDTVTGAVFDSAVEFKGVKDNRLSFELTRLTNGAY